MCSTMALLVPVKYRPYRGTKQKAIKLLGKATRAPQSPYT